MKICIFYIILFSLLLFGCTTKTVDQQIDIIDDSNNEYIYFDLVANCTKRRFLFDSHSNGNVIFKKKEENIKLKQIGTKNVNDFKTKLVRIDTLMLGKEKLYNIKAVLIEENHKNAFGNTQGIIGLNTIVKNHNWIFDFEKNNLTINKNPIQKDCFDFSLDYWLDIHQLPTITIEIDHKKKNFMIDTGYGKELGVFSKIELKGQKLEYHKTEWAELQGVTEKLYAKTILDSIKIGDKYFPNLILESIDDDNQEKNLLGIQFFRRFKKVAFDTNNRKIYFKK